MKALIIAAHPDDESLFMGGLIAEFKRWRWTALCVTDCDDRYNKRRRRELLRACNIYKKNGSYVKPFMLSIVKQKGRFSKSEIAREIKDFINKSGPFDIVFTHGSKGEYGHRTHKLIHNVVIGLRLPNIYHFYIPCYGETNLRAQLIKLSPRAVILKKQAINIYLKGSQKTNLLKIKKTVSYALNTKIERFYRYNQRNMIPNKN